MSKLVIVESPSKAHTIKKYLGSDYEVLASKGHVRDLPAKRLSVDVKHDFAPKYEIMKDKEISFEDKLTGAVITRNAVVQDRNIITSRGMGTSIDFALKLVEVMTGAEKASEIGDSILYFK